jgi:hypothetical protein
MSFSGMSLSEPLTDFNPRHLLSLHIGSVSVSLRAMFTKGKKGKRGGSSFGGAAARNKGRALRQGYSGGEHDSIGSMPAHARHRFVAVSAALALVNAKQQGTLSDDEIEKLAEFSGADRLCPGCGLRLLLGLSRRFGADQSAIHSCPKGLQPIV